MLYYLRFTNETQVIQQLKLCKVLSLDKYGCMSHYTCTTHSANSTYMHTLYAQAKFNTAMQQITCKGHFPMGSLSNTEGSCRFVLFGSRGIIKRCPLADLESALVIVPELCFKGAAAVVAPYVLLFEVAGSSKTAK